MTAKKDTAGLGRYRSAESKARAEANLRGAKPGEVRRKPLDDVLPKVAERLEELVEELPQGTPNPRELGQVRRLARMDLGIDRHELALERAISLTSANATRHMLSQSKLMSIRNDQGAILEEISRQRVAAEQRQHFGLPSPRTDRAHMLATTLVLLKAGALFTPDTSPETRVLLKEFIESHERDQREASARKAEMADLRPPTAQGDSDA